MTGETGDQAGRVWLVTGSSTGFGRTLAEAVLDRGGQVVATARDVRAVADLAERDPERVLARRLDVTDQASVHEAVDAAVGRFGQLDVVVNNAGHGLIGALEELSEDQLRAVLETNVFGAMAVTRAALPHMRARRQGCFVQMSSVGGVVGNPGHAIYATSKFALEGMSEALAGEVAPFGISVVIVEPGPFRTEFAGRSMAFAEPIADYRETPAGALRARFREQDGKQPNDPAKAAAIIIDHAGARETPLRLPLGPEALGRIREKLQRQLADLDAWESTLADTRY